MSLGKVPAILVSALAAMQTYHVSIKVDINYKNDTFRYTMLMRGNFDCESLGLAITGHFHDLVLAPLAILETNRNRTLDISSIIVSTVDKGDNISADKCVRDSRSIVIKCSYGAAECIDDCYDVDNHFMQNRKPGLTNDGVLQYQG